MTTECPKTVAACLKREKSQWEIGDCLIEEVGPPGEDQARTGAFSRFEQISNALSKLGVEYSIEMLRTLRKIADSFPHGKRLPSASWAVHQVAGSPEMLTAIMKRFRGEHLTVARAVELRDEIAAEAAKERDQAEKDEEKARDRAKNAKDEEDRKRAEKEAKEAEERRKKAQALAKGKKSTKKPDQPGFMTAIAMCLGEASDAMEGAKEAIKGGDRSAKAIDRYVDKLPEEAIAGFVEEALEAANTLQKAADTWRELANLYRRGAKNKRSHLSVVN